MGKINEKLMESMKGKISAALEASAVEVKDVYGDGQHVTIDVVSAQFEGKGSMKRQQMVFRSIWEELQTKVHAVDSMVCLTPQELQDASAH